MDELAFHRALFRPGTVLDVGAHDGALALPLAALQGAKVMAFEPLPSAFDRLEANVRAAHGGLVPPNLRLLRAALGDREGHADLSVPVVDGVVQEQWGSLAKDYAAHAGGRVAVETVRVPVLPVDALKLPDLTAAKVDAEGGEYEVLRGAVETLRRCRPVLTVEIEERHRPGSTWAVPAFLDALGYGTWFELDGAWHPMAAFDRGRLQRASPDPAAFDASHPYVFVFHALPREREAEALATLRAA